MKKVIYISNVNLKGAFLRGVIHKILGQEKAFRRNGFIVDMLYPDKGKVVLRRGSGETLLFKGGNQTVAGGSLYQKVKGHFIESWYGSINFDDCYNTIINEKYDAIYLRFFMPGSNLISFLNQVRSTCPGLIILLEYPTLRIKDLYQNTLVRRFTYMVNRNKVDKLNNLADYIITLTRDKFLFGKPAIFMPNGIDLDGIRVVDPPAYMRELVLVGVASDIHFYHGFDRLIRGLAIYNGKEHGVPVVLRLISNPLSGHLAELKNLCKDLGVEESVSFELPIPREQLKEVYKSAHLGIGTLALHRIGLNDNYSLKHREYAAFGLPFIMSKGDEHFEHSPFVLTVERDENPLPVQQIVDFYKNIRDQYPDYPQRFRESVEKQITWEGQMQGVFDVIKKGK